MAETIYYKVTDLINYELENNVTLNECIKELLYKFISTKENVDHKDNGYVPVETYADRGMFIVFEGIDRSGKTTQASLLQHRLNDKYQNFESIRFPNRTTGSGRILDCYLRDKNIKFVNNTLPYYLFVINRFEMKQNILRKLSQGINIICDRYSFSGISYFLAANKLEKVLPEEDFCDVSYRKMVKYEYTLPRPDLVFYMNVTDNKILENRGQFGEERFENTKFLTEVTNIYDRYFIHKGNWRSIDAQRDIEVIYENILRIYEYESSKERTKYNLMSPSDF